MAQQPNLAARLDELAHIALNLDDAIDLFQVGRDPNIIQAMHLDDAHPPQSRRIYAQSIFDQTNRIESTFKVKGILLESSLLPLRGRRMPSRRVLQHGKQIVKVGGLGSVSFLEAYAGMHVIYNYMASDFGEGRLRALPQQFDINALSIQASNKWFTPRRFAPTIPSIPFTLAEDPDRLLNTACSSSGGFVRLPGNVVEYFAVIGYSNGSPIIQPCKPTRFRTNSLVEIEINFVAFVAGHGEYVFEPVLKRITSIEITTCNFLRSIQLKIGAMTMGKKAPNARNGQGEGSSEDVNELAGKELAGLQINEVMAS